MWPEEIHCELAAAQVRIVGYVPDAGHKRLIELCQADKSMRAVVLSTEEEGIGLAAGASWQKIGVRPRFPAARS